jgi:cytochrome P450
MSFSFGPHSCPGYRFSILEAKIFIATLIPYFVFEPAECIKKFNAVVTRPYIDDKLNLGSRLPVRVKRYVSL